MDAPRNDKGQFLPGIGGNKETQFGKGNPYGGRKKGAKNFRTIIKNYIEKDVLHQDIDELKKQMSVGDAVVVSMLRKALKGDVAAAKLVIEHLDGKQLDVTADNVTHVKIVDLTGKFPSEDEKE